MISLSPSRAKVGQDKLLLRCFRAALDMASGTSAGGNSSFIGDGGGWLAFLTICRGSVIVGVVGGGQSRSGGGGSSFFGVYSVVAAVVSLVWQV